VQILRNIVLAIDTFFERFAITALVGMILIVIMQVFTRKLFNFVFFWSEEITLLLLGWFSFMGMAIGFREDLHMGMDSFTDYLPGWANRILDKVIDTTIFAFGMYLVIQGWDFTLLMAESTLAATKLPNSVLYVVMPVSGVMICGYSLLHAFGIDIKRHQSLEEGAE
jgi:TRAP-type transport system small permease protein